jgi:hypothetical protein
MRSYKTHTQIHTLYFFLLASSHQERKEGSPHISHQPDAMLSKKYWFGVNLNAK